MIVDNNGDVAAFPVGSNNVHVNCTAFSHTCCQSIFTQIYCFDQVSVFSHETRCRYLKGMLHFLHKYNLSFFLRLAVNFFFRRHFWRVWFLNCLPPTPLVWVENPISSHLFWAPPNNTRHPLDDKIQTWWDIVLYFVHYHIETTLHSQHDIS